MTTTAEKEPAPADAGAAPPADAAGAAPPADATADAGAAPPADATADAGAAQPADATVDAAGPGAPLAPRPSLLELLVAAAVAVGLMLLVNAFTAPLDAGGRVTDEHLYLRMAEKGPWGVWPRGAPFAYRAGTALVAGAVMRVAGVNAETAYRGLALVCLPLFFLSMYVLARAYSRSRLRSGIAMALVGVSYTASKRLLFNPISTDALGLLLVGGACLLLVHRRYLALAILTTVGVACREFVAVPAMALALSGLTSGHVGWRPRRGLRYLLPLAGAVVGALVVRIAIPVSGSTQNVDPMYPKTWDHVLQVLNSRWVANDVGAIATFLLPLLCVWHARPAAVAVGPRRLPRWVVLYALALFAVTLFAGTNFAWFAAYFAPVLVIGYVIKGADEPLPLQLVLLALVAALNRIVELVPQPRKNPAAYTGFVSHFSHQLDVYSATRMFELAAVVVAYWAMRALVAELSPSPSTRRP